MSEENIQRHLQLQLDNEEWYRERDRMVSFEELFQYICFAGIAGGRGNEPALERPDELGFEMHNEGTELAKSVTSGDLAGLELVFEGTGFAVDEDGNPTAGTVSDIKIYRNGDQVASMRLILPFDVMDMLDAIEAGTGDAYSPTDYSELRELLVPAGSFMIGNGSKGDDTFFGSAGNDKIDAKKGDDILFMFEGDDRLNGNVGRDLVDARHVEGKVTIDLVKDRATHGEFTTKLIGIEDVVGSLFNDTIKGDNGRNILAGNDSSDTLYGRGGKDLFVFGVDGDADRVKDFEDGKDKLDLILFDFGNKALALAAFSELGSKKDNKVEFEFEGTTILITGADLKEITAADIVI